MSATERKNDGTANPADETQSPTWDANATHLRHQWKHPAPLLGCAIDPTGQYVFASSMDNSVHRWAWPKDDTTDDTPEKQKSARPSVEYAGHAGWLRAMCFTPDGSTLITGGYDGKLCFWCAQSEASPSSPDTTIEAHRGWIRAIVHHPKEPWVITAGNDLAVRIWSSQTGEKLAEFAGHEKHIYSLLLHPNGKTLLSGDLAGMIRQWDLSEMREERTLDAKLLHTYHGGQQVDYGGVRTMALSPDTGQLACGGLHKATNPFAGVQEPLVVVLDWETGKQLRTHEATEIPRGIVWRLFYANDTTLIGGVGGDQGYLLFWGKDKTETHKLKLRNTLTDVDRHPNQLDLASVHHDGYVRIHRSAQKTG